MPCFRSSWIFERRLYPVLRKQTADESTNAAKQPQKIEIGMMANFELAVGWDRLDSRLLCWQVYGLDCRLCTSLRLVQIWCRMCGRDIEGALKNGA